MRKKKVMVVLAVAMVMTGSLTGCQKTGGEADGDMQQAEKAIAETSEETTEGVEVSGTEQETIQQESGAFLKLTDSPEYQACAEWWDFCAGYDTDFSILEQMEEEVLEAESEYEAYACYTPEMEQKVDEICEKYGLSKLSGFRIVNDYSELCNKAEVGDFCVREAENIKQTVLSGYLYNGAFLMEGNAALAGSSMYEASYQFARVTKGYFTSAYLDFGDISQCSAREYTTKKGENVLFVNITNEERGTHTYIIAEREKSFIVINVLGDMSDITDVNDEGLELMAEAFDFAAIP